MKTKLLTLILIATSILSAQAQEYVFKVLASKGGNEFQKESSWQLISSGSKLTADSKVRVTNGGYLGLVHRSGKTVEIKNPGVYSISDLSQKISSKTEGLASKYASFVVNQMAGESESKRSMEVLGTVSRAVHAITLESPEKTTVLKSIPFQLNWENPSNESGPFIVTVKTMSEKEVYRTEVSTGSAIIDLSKSGISTSDNYMITVKSKTSKNISKDVLIQLVNDKDSESIVKEYSILKNELDLTSALDNVVLASYFEEKGLYLNALAFLKTAATLAPDVPEFKANYQDFLSKKIMKVD